MSYVALPDYLCIGLSANQTSNLAIGDHIEFDQSDGVGSRIVLATGVGQANGIVTLLAGARYEIEFAVLCSFLPAGFALATFTLREDPGGANVIMDHGDQLAVDVGYKSSTTPLAQVNDIAIAKSVFTPASDIDVVVQHSDFGGTFTFNNWRNRCFMNIQAFHVTGRP